MAKQLKANVYVDGVLYEAGSTPPKEVADQIDNPKAWTEPEEPVTSVADVESDDEEPAKTPAKKAASRKTSSN